MSSSSNGIKLGKISFGKDGQVGKFRKFKLNEEVDLSGTKTINGSNNILCPFFDDKKVHIFDESMVL